MDVDPKRDEGVALRTDTGTAWVNRVLGGVDVMSLNLSDFVDFFNH